VTTDGRHFVMIKAVERETLSKRLNVVLNRGEEVRRRTAGASR
jgi:hypothetical protein